MAGKTPPGNGQGNVGQDVEEMIELKPVRLTECLHLFCGDTVYTSVYTCQPFLPTTIIPWRDIVGLITDH